MSDGTASAKLNRNSAATDSEIPNYEKAMNNNNLASSTTPVNNNNRFNDNNHSRSAALVHGRKYGRWVFDGERLCLVLDGRPITRGSGEDAYRAFFGIYEIDLELRASSQLLDRIFQVRTLGWVDARCMSDLLRALDDILYPQQNLCSAGCDKRIENPGEFLRARLQGEQRSAA